MDISQLPLLQLGALAGGVIASGLIAGLLAGLLGIGGGIIVVPMLFYVFTALNVDPHVVMHMAVGTSLATIVPTTFRAAHGHHSHGAVDFSIVRGWGPWILTGVVTGTIIASLVGGRVLMGVFASFALLFAVNMAIGREDWRIGTSLPGPFLRLPICLLIGTVSTLMGVGAGTLGVTTMTLFGVPIRRAVATAAALGLLIAIPGALGFMISGWDVPGRPPFSLGYVNLVGLLFIMPASVMAAPLGVKLAHSIGARSLRLVFAAFLVVTSIRMFWDLF